MDIRKVKFEDSVTGDCWIVLTNAPKEDIKKWIITFNKDQDKCAPEEQKHYHYVKMLYQSGIDPSGNVEAIGWDEVYDLNDTEEFTIASLEELEKEMQENGIVIRAVPLKTRTLHELNVFNRMKYPEAKIEYIKAQDKEMLVEEVTPAYAGKFMIESVRSTTNSVLFIERFYDSIAEAVEAVLSGEAVSPNYTTGKPGNLCSSYRKE